MSLHIFLCFSGFFCVCKWYVYCLYCEFWLSVLYFLSLFHLFSPIPFVITGRYSPWLQGCPSLLSSVKIFTFWLFIHSAFLSSFPFVIACCRSPCLQRCLSLVSSVTVFTFQSSLPFPLLSLIIIPLVCNNVCLLYLLSKSSPINHSCILSSSLSSLLHLRLLCPSSATMSVSRIFCQSLHL